MQAIKPRPKKSITYKEPYQQNINIMKTKLVIVTILSALLAFDLFAKGPKGGQTRLDDLRLKSDYEKVKKGDELVVVCKVCNAITIEDIETDQKADSFSEAGKELECSTCKAKAIVSKFDQQQQHRPHPRNKPKRNIIYVNEHGEECLIVSKVVSKPN